VVSSAVSVSVAVDRDTFVLLAVSWLASWAVGSDETFGGVVARVIFAERSGSTFGEVLAVIVSGASYAIALVVSAESSNSWPAAVVVGSANLLLAFVGNAKALAITAFLGNVDSARSVANTFWTVAHVGFLVAKLTGTAVADVGALDVDTFLLDALVSFKTSVLEEVFAVFVASAFLWDTHTRFAK